MRKILLAALLLSTSASAHEWYDPKCCSGQDCAPIADCGEISSRPNGAASWNGYVFSREQIHPSQDSRCHVCLFKGNSIHPLCLYIQMGT